MYKLIRTLLYLFSDPETPHNLALGFLKILGLTPFRKITKAFCSINHASLEQNIFGLHFKNPVGLAAGFDKNALCVSGLEALGFGHIEIGTLTKVPQTGNPRQRMFRLSKERALINRMGFNNLGVEVVRANLSSLKPLIVLGVSLGKNKDTALENAKGDYLHCFRELYDLGDYFVVNVSSPNTPNLRQLQDKSFLLQIISSLNQYRAGQSVRKPLLVKIAPDLTPEAIDEIIEVCRQGSVDGVIAANTTLSREGIETQINEMGGLSGEPVKARATQIIKHIREKTKTLPIIGVGGIFTAEDAYEKIRAGASLVQVYTGFIYEGPFIVKNINKGLVELLQRDGFNNIAQAVGVDVK